MKFPVPRPGLVIRYSFLWSHEKDAGADEAAKDRPCAIVVAASRQNGGDINVVVAPVTHAPPKDPADSIEIPAAVCRSLGLDDDCHWLRLDELNRFAWPGFDLRPVLGAKASYSYGMLPQPLYEVLRQGIVDRQKVKGRARTDAGLTAGAAAPRVFRRRLAGIRVQVGFQKSAKRSG